MLKYGDHMTPPKTNTITSEQTLIGILSLDIMTKITKTIYRRRSEAEMSITYVSDVEPQHQVIRYLELSILVSFAHVN